MNCRNCNTEVHYEFIDLFSSPPSNDFLASEDLDRPEVFFPLKVMICQKCYLVQIAEYKKSSDLFSKDYVYFSSFSTSWLKHAEDYVEQMTNRFKLG